MTSKVYNKQALNNFTSGMMDIQLPRNPLASEVILIFNEVLRDHYQDSIMQESLRVKKYALVKKNADLHYVQQQEDLLLEDDLDKIPWIVTLTMTDLPRRPRTDDQIVIEGLSYNISYVAPINRNLDNVVYLTVYPERNDIDDLKIYSVKDLEDGYYDILYGGSPIALAYDREAIFNPELRLEWTSRPEFPPEGTKTLYIIDKEDKVVSFDIEQLVNDYYTRQ